MQNTDSSFAARLKRLFDKKRKPNGKRYSKKEVIESSPALSRLILWRLERGETLKPSYEVVRALADFFGVEPDYFFNDNYKIEEDEPEEQKPVESELEKQLDAILRSFDVSAEGRRALRAMIEALRKKK